MQPELAKFGGGPHGRNSPWRSWRKKGRWAETALERGGLSPERRPRGLPPPATEPKVARSSQRLSDASGSRGGRVRVSEVSFLFRLSLLASDLLLHAPVLSEEARLLANLALGRLPEHARPWSAPLGLRLAAPLEDVSRPPLVVGCLVALRCIPDAVAALALSQALAHTAHARSKNLGFQMFSQSGS